MHLVPAENTNLFAQSLRKNLAFALCAHVDVKQKRKCQTIASGKTGRRIPLPNGTNRCASAHVHTQTTITLYVPNPALAAAGRAGRAGQRNALDASKCSNVNILKALQRLCRHKRKGSRR